MAIFGRGTARQRMQRASRQALSIPAFRTAADCTPWVIGGLWPAELDPVTAENAAVADYLSADLQRIVDGANARLRAIVASGLAGAVQAEQESRVVQEARAYAVARVESTIRQLHTAAAARQPEVMAPGEPIVTERYPNGVAWQPDSAWFEPIEGSRASSTAVVAAAEPVAQDAGEPDAGTTAELPSIAGDPALEDAAPAEPAGPDESTEQRLHRLLQFVARQEAGLRWAIADRDDGTTVLATDLAFGWIPPGIALPEGVTLLEPGRRSGAAAAMVGIPRSSAAAPRGHWAQYTPGNPFDAGNPTTGWPTDTSAQPLELPMVDELGWKLSAATHWRDGLPRMVNTLVKAASTGTGVVAAEIDVLRVHLDTARYQLVATYPDIELAVLLNCQLLAATERLASGDEVAANYHYSWFEALSVRPVSQWGANG